MYNKAVDTYLSKIKYIPDQCKNQWICNKTFHRSFTVLDFIPDKYKSQELCDRVVIEDPLYYCVIPIYIKLAECVIKLLLIVWKY